MARMNVEEEALRRIMREEINQAMDVRFTEFDRRFEDFEAKLAKFFGDTHRYFGRRFNKFEKKFDKKFDAMQTSVDGVIGQLDDDDAERAAMGAQLDRHETNLSELARHTGAKLSTP